METVIESVKRDARVFASDAASWSAVVHRDGNADGLFFYSVRTTSV